MAKIDDVRTASSSDARRHRIIGLSGPFETKCVVFEGLLAGIIAGHQHCGIPHSDLGRQLLLLSMRDFILMKSSAIPK